MSTKLILRLYDAKLSIAAANPSTSETHLYSSRPRGATYQLHQWIHEEMGNTRKWKITNGKHPGYLRGLGRF